jgi:hypothetical protein
MDTNKGKFHNLISFAFVASSIALIMGLSIIATYSIKSDPANNYELEIQLLILIIISFLINLLVPVTKNIRVGILITLPTLFVLLYFYQIRPFFEYPVPNRFYYIIAVACTFGPLLEIFELMCIVLFSRLGTIVNTRLFSKHID